MKTMTRMSWPLVSLLATFLCSLPALAGELKPGTVISASNLNQVRNDTFEGHKIGEMVPEKMEHMIMKEGMTLKLRHSAEVPIDSRLIAASKANAHTVKFDPSTRSVVGWKAGWPFPNIDMNDPWAGEKLIWNHHYGAPHSNAQVYPMFSFLFIDGNKGLERIQQWTWQRYFQKGRIGGPETEGDGKILQSGLLFALYPRDIAGLGTYTIRYDGSQFEDSWAYLKAVRRVRRLPGGAWMDPIGGTDMLNDDQEIFNAHPTWYPKYKLLGKRWVLAVAHGKPAQDESKKGTPDEWPRVDLRNKPYWNPLDDFEPREVYVIEATTPKGHPYSKKILYLETKFPRFYYSEAYDQKGQFWKWIEFHLQTKIADDGYPGVISSMGYITDLKRRHSTIFVSNKSWKLMNKSNPDLVSLGKLEAAGK